MMASSVTLFRSGPEGEGDSETAIANRYLFWCSLLVKRGLQVILGAEFILALLASLRLMWSVSKAAFVADIIAVSLLLVAAGLLARGVKRRCAVDLPQRTCIVILIVLGVALRFAWVAAMPPVQLSDAADYLTLARTLARTGTYQDYETGHQLLAFRPPGYPAFLSLCLSFAGDHWWTPALINIFLFICSALIVMSAARALGGQRSVLFALTLFTLWPSDIFLTGLAFSEPFSLLLVSISLWLFSLCLTQGLKASIGAGVAGGAAALTRPTFLLLPLLWSLFVICTPNMRKRAIYVGSAVVMMIATLLPWTIRNYRVLHGFALISTNGGDVLYRANNSYATGSYTAKAEVNLSGLQKTNEVKWDRESSRRAIIWMWQHPLKTMTLALHKAVYFAGDDETGVYWSMARGNGLRGASYVALRVMSDVWWQLLSVLGLVALWRRKLVMSSTSCLFSGAFVLLTLVHLVYESQARYHMPAVALLIVTIVSALSLQLEARTSSRVDSCRLAA